MGTAAALPVQRPLLPTGKVADLLVVTSGFVLAYVFQAFLGRLPWLVGPLSHLGLRDEPPMGLFAFAAAVMAADVWITWSRRRRADALYEFLKDLGQAVTGGLGVESALQQTCARRPGGPGRLFGRALQEAHDRPLEEALLATAYRSGDASLVEASDLCARAMRADGEVGAIMSRLGERLAQTREMDRASEAELSGSVFILRVLALGIFPVLFGMVAIPFEFPMEPHVPRFFGFMALAVGGLDYRLYGSLRRAVAKQPLYLGIVWAALDLGTDVGANIAAS